jgi:hypothetical protein
MPPRQRNKLALVSGTRGVTDAGLSEILRLLRTCPSLLDDDCSTRTVERSAHDFLDEIGHDIILPTYDGKGFAWRIAPVQTSLPAFIHTSQTFAELMRSTLRRFAANHMWNLVLYADDITPGDLLRPECDRKVAAYYYTFLEFGRAVLCLTEAWLPLGILREKVIKKEIRGGSGCVFRMLQRHMLLGPTGLSTAGVAFTLSDGPRLL